MTVDSRRRRGVGGRRSKGERHTFTVRLPSELAVVVMDRASQEGMTYNDWIARVVAGHAHALGAYLQPDSIGQPPSESHSESKHPRAAGGTS